MNVSTNEEKDRIVFVVTGLIDESGAEKLKTAFQAVDKEKFETIVFDFRGVSHIGSAGIGKLLLFYKDVALKGGKIEIIHIPRDIFELFQTLKLDTVFQLRKA